MHVIGLVCCFAAIVQLKASHDLEENVSVRATRIFRHKFSAVLKWISLDLSNSTKPLLQHTWRCWPRFCVLFSHIWLTLLSFHVNLGSVFRISTRFLIFCYSLLHYLHNALRVNQGLTHWLYV